MSTNGAGGGAGAWDSITTDWATALTGGTDHLWVDSSDAVFAGTAGIVTLGGPITAGNISISVANYNIATTADSPLTLTGGITATNLTGVPADAAKGGEQYHRLRRAHF